MASAAVNRLRWQAQQGLRGIGLPGWVAAVLAVVCAVGWWWVVGPMRSETPVLDAESHALEQRLARRDPAAAEVSPRQQLAAFEQRFPGERGIGTALGRLHAAARRHGLQLDRAEFKFARESSEPLARYSIVLPVKTDYRTLRRFTRDALRELPGLAMEEVNLRRSDPKSAQLEAQLRFVLFVAPSVASRDATAN